MSSRIRGCDSPEDRLLDGLERIYRQQYSRWHTIFRDRDELRQMSAFHRPGFSRFCAAAQTSISRMLATLTRAIAADRISRPLRACCGLPWGTYVTVTFLVACHPNNAVLQHVSTSWIIYIIHEHCRPSDAGGPVRGPPAFASDALARGLGRGRLGCRAVVTVHGLRQPQPLHQVGEAHDDCPAAERLLNYQAETLRRVWEFLAERVDHLSIDPRCHLGVRR